MYNCALLTIDEIWLKGDNRQQFVRLLHNNVIRVIKEVGDSGVQFSHEGAKMIIECKDGISETLLKRLQKIPGVLSVHLAIQIGFEWEELEKAVLEEMGKSKPWPDTFKVQTSRSYKEYPTKSPEVSRLIGGHILQNCPGLKVKLKNPGLTVHIRILHRGIFVSTRSFPGVGGLPVGMSGHVLCLLSGGFDSPVASYLMSKRGCDQSFAFFHAYPYVGEEVKEKVLDLAKALGTFQRKARLYTVPFGDIQKKIADHCEPAYRTLLFRWAMVQCSNILARKIRAMALVTGDALGQVSSQTLHNMVLLDKTSDKPILRPLIGFRKNEIIDLARLADTHDISVIPHDDACELFSAKHPVTKPWISYWKRITSELGLEEDFEEAVQKSERINLWQNT